MNARPRVLIVDNHAVGAELAAFLLEAGGFEVATERDAEGARRRIAAARPDLILMDVQLPGEDGLALTRTLKADAATRDIPVVACTACAMPGDEATMIAAGCQGYLAKPIEVDRFVQQVLAMLPGDAGGVQTQDRQSGTAAAPPRDTAGDARHP